MERRINEIWANMASIIEERSAQDMAQTIPNFESYADTLLKDLRAAMLLSNEQALELQHCGESGKSPRIWLLGIHVRASSNRDLVFLKAEQDNISSVMGDE